jgi:hypothetical protein
MRLQRKKIITSDSISLVDGVDTSEVQQKFFALTATSKGVLASVRIGGLKKDLSLLFEKEKNDLPAPYRFSSSAVQEPSLRPMSPDLTSYNPEIPMRHFQSWTNMRHYYRMYRDTTDALDGGSNNTGGKGSLQWDSSKPWTDMSKISEINELGTWDGSDHYWKFPIVAKYTVIYSHMYRKHPTFGGYELYVVYTPVVTFWNPYNVELRVPDGRMGGRFGAPRVWPVSAILFTRDPNTGLHVQNDQDRFAYLLGEPQGQNNVTATFRSSGGSDIVFAPGQFRVFSLEEFTTNLANSYNMELVPGFNPLGINGGDRMRIRPYPGSSLVNAGLDPRMSLRFGIGGTNFNMNDGNTPGSLSLTQLWDGKSSPMIYANDWFRADENTMPRTYSESFTQITEDATPANLVSWNLPAVEPAGGFESDPVPFAYAQMVLKGATPFNYDSISGGVWSRTDWRSRNWIQAPPTYYGNTMYISENIATANTQRWDNPYSINFGPLTNIGDAVALADPFGDKSIAILGSGASAIEQVSQVPALELPTAPISSLAGFAGMKINPGWTDPVAIVAASSNPTLRLGTLGGTGATTNEASAYAAEAKIYAYQSGVTGPGIGNSFLHPIIESSEVYRNYDNSTSMDPQNREVPDNYQANDLKLFRDYWDHIFLLNDALWDDYFLSSLSKQSRTTDPSAPLLEASIDQLIAGEPLANNRYEYYGAGLAGNEVKDLLEDSDNYLKSAAHLMIDGMFNVNSTSVAAWKALFAGIRERKAVYRDENGVLGEIEVPSDQRIVITRHNTSNGDEELDNPENGATMPSGQKGWNGVRFLDDAQLQTLAEQCVKQVKLRGPFLNFAEFINRRLSDDSLGIMGSLQNAIDYDDESPNPASINYMFKEDPDYMIDSGDLSGLEIGTVGAATGSRFAGIPGYIIQSDLLKPIGNTLSVRDDTFRIRAYGEANGPNGDPKGKVRVWCEAIVQRLPEYIDASNSSHEASRIMNANGEFQDNPAITNTNRLFGRKFKVVSFKWLDESEI